VYNVIDHNRPGEEYLVMATPNLIGTQLGGYAIQALIGSGGMANVYRGFDSNLQRSVAIKVLSPAIAAQPGFAERFRQEARLIASLRHPNIVQVYDFGEHNGHTYMVQELLPGPTLEQRLADATTQGVPLARADIMSIAAQLASALDAAHAAGIIHRDVKPSNALWNAHGALALTDFGIAKNTLTTANYTQVGLVMGTPTYLSPEQAQGLPLTPSSDIYALGVVLYELITGTTPFESPTPMRIVMSHIQEPPPPLRPLRADLPAAAEAVVLRALAKEPSQRFATAGELAQALERAWPAIPAVVTLGTIHNQATQHWSSPRVAGGAAFAPGPANPPVGVGTPPAATPPVAAGAGTRPMLLILGTLLALLLLGGVALALRGERGVADRTGSATTAPAQAGADTSAPALSATAVPTPPAIATAVLAGQPDPATSVATPPVAAATDPLVQLRELLVNSVADQRISHAGDALIAQLDLVQQALAQGDTPAATSRLHELQQQLLAGARGGTITPEVMRQALTGIALIARNSGLTLPFSATSG
jgi:eukaryotic-like serine/threonine-protein kinase